MPVLQPTFAKQLTMEMKNYSPDVVSVSLESGS